MPSRLVNALWLSWLAVAVVLVGQTGLPTPWQLAIAGAVLVITAVPLGRHVFLRGDRAVRALEWSSADHAPYYVWLGRSARRLAAYPDGCRRYGPYLWVLRFQTSEGLVQLLIDARRQEPRTLRRLARRLFGTAPNPGRSGRAVTAS